MLAFNVDEEQERDEGQREGCVDKRVVPRYNIAARVQSEEKEDQSCYERRSAEEVNTLKS